MTKMEELFGARINPGVYLAHIDISPGKLIKSSKESGFQAFYVNGQNITNKGMFLTSFANAMHFPPYFGDNWDAFDECIRDLEWRPGKGYIVLYMHFEVFAQADPQEFGIALDVFRSAVNYWQSVHVPMFVLMMGDESFGRQLQLPKLTFS